MVVAKSQTSDGVSMGGAMKRMVVRSKKERNAIFGRDEVKAVLRVLDGILAQVEWSEFGEKGGKREWSARSGMRLSVDGGDEREEGRRRGRGWGKSLSRVGLGLFGRSVATRVVHNSIQAALFIGGAQLVHSVTLISRPVETESLPYIIC